jgi:hypothetical protein
VGGKTGAHLAKSLFHRCKGSTLFLNCEKINTKKYNFSQFGYKFTYMRAYFNALGEKSYQ